MRILISTIFFCFLILSAKAQHSGSPYSIYGVGILEDNEVTFNKLKGGLGISSPKTYVINNVNPALLALNSFTIFDFGVEYDQRTVATDSLSQDQKGGGLSYISLAVPLKTGKWGLNLGVNPYSIIKYNINSERDIFNDTTQALYEYIGDGGLTEVYIQSGYKIAKPLYIGFKAAYLFGSKNTHTVISPEPATNAFSSALFRSEKSNGFLFGFGAAYIKEFKTEGNFLSVGAIYELNTNLNTTRDEWLGNNSDVEISDTVNLIVDGAKSEITVPRKLGLGISYTKEYKWSIGLDYYMQDWSDFSNSAGLNEGMTRSNKWILGGEYTPDFFSVNSYWKRVTFLAGIRFVKTPLSLQNEDINNFGINFGVSLPFSNGSTVNLGFTGGRFGTTNNNLIRENYFKISLGISFNDQSYGWYRKQRKFN